MTITLWCLVAVVLMPVALAMIGTIAKVKQLGSIDNNYPRQRYDDCTGLPVRLLSAQQNAWEAVIMFAVAVLVTHIAGVTAGATDNLALAFVGSRVAHTLCYALNLGTLRTLSFFAATGCILWMFKLAAAAGGVA